MARLVLDSRVELWLVGELGDDVVKEGGLLPLEGLICASQSASRRSQVKQNKEYSPGDHTTYPFFSHGFISG